MYNLKYTMRNVSWGTVFPNTSLITIIAMGYMIISPIINGLACFSFFLLYCAWKCELETSSFDPRLQID